MKIINLIASGLILSAIGLGVMIAKESCQRNAMLNEYEYLLADSWTAQQEWKNKMADCRDQLGVFYKERK